MKLKNPTSSHKHLWTQNQSRSGAREVHRRNGKNCILMSLNGQLCKCRRRGEELAPNCASKSNRSEECLYGVESAVLYSCFIKAITKTAYRKTLTLNVCCSYFVFAPVFSSVGMFFWLVALRSRICLNFFFWLSSSLEMVGVCVLFCVWGIGTGNVGACDDDDNNDNDFPPNITFAHVQFYGVA